VRTKTMKPSKLAVGDETLELEVDGKTVKVVTRPADGGQFARLFEFRESPSWADSSPMSNEEVAAVVRSLIAKASKDGEQAGVMGVPPAAAMSFPDDPHVYVSTVEPLTFSLPGSPTGLTLEMDAHGDGHLWALGGERISLGCDGMWWIVNCLIVALSDPNTAAQWPRFLSLGSRLGGPATQASIETSQWGVAIVWRKLDSGVVGETVAVQQLAYDRVEGWLQLLRPVRDDLTRSRTHRQRLLPARIADRWARALERYATN
jgi:hypothetical protein